MLSNDSKIIIQTRAKAAFKTFIQAFFAVIMLMIVPQLAGWTNVVQNGGSVDIDVHWWANILIAAVGAGLAAALSFVWNTLLKPTDSTVSVAPPVAVDE